MQGQNPPPLIDELTAPFGCLADIGLMRPKSKHNAPQEHFDVSIKFSLVIFQKTPHVRLECAAINLLADFLSNDKRGSQKTLHKIYGFLY